MPAWSTLSRRSLLASVVLATNAEALTTLQMPHRLSRRGLRNLAGFARLFGYVRYFHPSDQAAAADWSELVLSSISEVENAGSSARLRDALMQSFASVAPTLRIERRPSQVEPARSVSEASEIAWRHFGVAGLGSDGFYRSERVAAPADLPATAQLDLPFGLIAIVPLRLSVDVQGRTQPDTTSAFVHPTPLVSTPSGDDRALRIAAVIETWNVFQHFYPYFDVVEVNWRAELDRALIAAATDADAESFDRTLSRLVAALQDGHGRVYREIPRGRAPVAWEWIEDGLVITGVAPSVPDLSIGDVVLAMNGRPVATLVSELEEVVSGATPERRRWRALEELARGDIGQRITLTLRRSDHALQAEMTLVPASEGNPVPPAYALTEELSEGILYFDLRQVRNAEQITSQLDRLTAARAVIFDVRGFPGLAALNEVLPRLSGHSLRSNVNNIPIATQPDRRGIRFQTSSWSIAARAPRLSAPIAFLTDARAMSSAETLMAIVETHGLGAIFGERTAGTNGNFAMFRTVTGHHVTWTGMQVLKPDRSRLHGVGVQPTQVVHRSVAGVRAGRDEVIDAAIAYLSETLRVSP